MRAPSRRRLSGWSPPSNTFSSDSLCPSGDSLPPRPNRFEHAVQVCGCAFDVGVLVLPGPAFRSQYCTTVQVLKVTVGELVPSLVGLVFLVINTQMPTAKLPNSMLP